MFDIRAIRDNPAAFDAGLLRRGLPPQSAEILALDSEWRALTVETQALQARRNDASKAIGAAKGKGDEAAAAALMAEVADIKDKLPDLEARERDLSEKLNAMLAIIPNSPAPDVPDGVDETGNVELKRWGSPRAFDFAIKAHDEIGPALGMDFEAGAKLSGARFTVLRGPMARLNRALAQYMLDHQTGVSGYTEIAPPLLVRDEAVFATGSLPKFAEDLFQTTDGRWLIPTAEVSLTSLVMGDIIAADTLPLRFTALTPCFRSEAGAAGRDTRGYIRQHQFEKVEMVSITTPDAAEAEHERMTRSAEAVLEALELPYRRIVLCTGDMGFQSQKTFDLEVWLPAQDTYREISSCSNCGDFQARRMNARYRPEGEKTSVFVHTLNGSGLAIGRTLVAVIENYQQADGSVRVPDVLRPYMGGLDVLTPA